MGRELVMEADSWGSGGIKPYTGSHWEFTV